MPGAGDPLEYRTWTEWSYAMCDLDLLTMSEVIERLALELWVGRVLGTNGLGVA